jgi:NADPH-dependent ferric siderophore reductase
MADTPARQAPSGTRLRVVRTERITPHMLRVVLADDDGVFVGNDFTDKYVKLVFARPGHELPWPLDLMEMRRTRPEDQRPRVRTYTVRSHDPATQQITIDFVIHGDGGGEGVAGPWAVAARPGDTIVALGPGGAYAPRPRGDVDWHLVIGDESALPAISSALEAMPAGVPVVALIEVADESEKQDLSSPGDLDVTWLLRDAPGYRTGESFVGAVRALSFRPGRVQVFVHGELGAMRDLRRHFLDDRAVPAELLSLSGYWRRGKDEDGFQAEKAEEPRRARETARAASS